MGDDHVDGQVQHVEHGAGGLFTIFADGEAFAEAVPHDAFRELKVILKERHAGVGDVIGEEPVAIGRIERQFAPGVERAEEPHEFTRCGGENARIEISQSGCEDADRFFEPSYPFLGFFPKSLRRASVYEAQKTI